MKRLPPEMIENLFSYLNGREVLKCRDVCSEWRDAVDNLPDTAWREICLRETYYEDYIAAHKKYGLSWRHTYRALNSWEDIASADMTTRKLTDVKMQHFKVLPNEVVACFQCNRIKNASKGHSDTIMYYNLQTFQECGRDEFDFVFCPISSVIKKRFYVLLVATIVNKIINYKICIVIRQNMKKVFVGEISCSDHFSVIGTKVYFRDKSDCKIYFSQLLRKNGETNVMTKALKAFKNKLDSFKEAVIAYAKNDIDGNLNILTCNGLLYVYEDEDFELEWTLNAEWVRFNVFDEFGFDWKSPPLLDWLLTHGITTFRYQKQKCVVHARHENGILAITKNSASNLLKIHYFKMNIHYMGNFKAVFRSRQMLRTIPLAQPIKQIDIIETATSHKFLALCKEELHIFEFQYANCNISYNISLSKKRKNSDSD